MNWDKTTEEKFRKILQKVPIFLRPMVEGQVSKKAEGLAKKENHPEVTERHMVDAFFQETPFGFHGPMKNDMKELGIEYTQYGHPE